MGSEMCIRDRLYSGKRGSPPIPNTATGSNCEWWYNRAERNNPNITSGDSNIDTERDTFMLANDFRSGSGPTLAVSRDSVSTTTTYQGSAYALRNFTKPYRFAIQDMPTFGGDPTFQKERGWTMHIQRSKLDHHLIVQD